MELDLNHIEWRHLSLYLDNLKLEEIEDYTASSIIEIKTSLQKVSTIFNNTINNLGIEFDDDLLNLWLWD